MSIDHEKRRNVSAEPDRKFPVQFDAASLKDPEKGMKSVRAIDPKAEITIQAEMTEAQFRELTGRPVNPFLSMKGYSIDNYPINIDSVHVLEEFHSWSIQFHLTRALLRQNNSGARQLTEGDMIRSLLKEAEMKPGTIFSLIKALDKWPNYWEFPDDELLKFAKQEGIRLADLSREE